MINIKKLNIVIISVILLFFSNSSFLLLVIFHHTYLSPLQADLDGTIFA